MPFFQEIEHEIDIMQIGLGIAWQPHSLTSSISYCKLYAVILLKSIIGLTGPKSSSA
jgi:hypothetical protein